MAQTKEKVSGTPSRTASEIKEWYEQNYSKILHRNRRKRI